MEQLFIKYLKKQLSSSEEKLLLKKTASDAGLKQLYIHIQNTYSLLCLLPEASDERIGLSGYERFQKIRNRKNVRLLLRRVIAYAASFTLLLVLTGLLVSYFIDQATRRYTGLVNSVYVPAGQRSRLTLGDGTVVWLNAQSTLTYPSVFSNERLVTLTGEAFFEVAADPTRPFSVEAKGILVKATGTRFNVTSYPETDFTQVALLEGNVMTHKMPEQPIFLKPNQQIIYSDNGVRLDTIEHADYFLWKDGVYSFVNEPLGKIIQKLERYYDVQIEAADLPVLAYEYTVKFRQKDGLDLILRMLQKTYPFRIKRTDDVIYLKKPNS